MIHSKYFVISAHNYIGGADLAPSSGPHTQQASNRDRRAEQKLAEARR